MPPTPTWQPFLGDADRELAFANLQRDAAHYGVATGGTRWQELGRHAHTPNPARR